MSRDHGTESTINSVKSETTGGKGSLTFPRSVLIKDLGPVLKRENRGRRAGEAETSEKVGCNQKA